MKDFWSDRRVFVTHPASFRGTWLCMQLLAKGAQVFGYGPAPKSQPNLFELESVADKAAIIFGDLSERESLNAALQFSEAEILISCGSDFSLKEFREHSFETLSAEILGTASVLECLKETATVRAAVFLSSDKVYRRDGANPLVEDSPTEARDIFSGAKLGSEIVVRSYREQYFTPSKFNKHKVALAVARIGQALGGGDFAEDSLIPQAVEAFINQRAFLPKKPHSVRSWMSIVDQVEGILVVAQALFERGPKLAPLWNIGSDEQVSVHRLVQLLARAWGASETLQALPPPEVGTSYHPVLSSLKIAEELGWRPHATLDETAVHVMNWYKKFYSSSQ